MPMTASSGTLFDDGLDLLSTKPAMQEQFRRERLDGYPMLGNNLLGLLSHLRRKEVPHALRNFRT
jgi:hypothetical protein